MTTALLYSLDAPTSPFYAASKLALIIAHAGDTRAILASSPSGLAHRLTSTHHPDSRRESDRLRRVGAGLVTDSFGESRLGGALANSRGIGDKKFKRMGVTAEPEITKRVLDGNDWAFLVIVSDGVSGFISDQEIVDLARGHKNPTKAAEAIINFATEGGGSDDNSTAIVLPLAGWSRLNGDDLTKDRRNFRQKQNAGGSRARRQ